MADINKDKLVKNCRDIVEKNYQITSDNKVLIFYDEECELAFELGVAYEKACEELGVDFEKINFYSFGGVSSADELDEENLSNFADDKVKAKVDELNEGDLVCLCQSKSFRMSKYRWRNLLHNLGLKVAEHSHLGTNEPSEYNTYVESLNYDLPYYKKASKFLMDKISKSNEIKLVSKSGKELIYSGPMDVAYENAANFEGKKDWGSRFPVGEVFTESLDLETLNGEFEIYAFPNINIKTELCENFTCQVENGILVSHNGPKEFDEIFQMIKTENPEGLVYIRELGLGLNRGIKRDTRLGDISSYERLEGVHFSLGMKHGIYRKKLWPKYGRNFYQRFHIDCFVDVEQILIDGEVVYEYSKGYLVE